MLFRPRRPETVREKVQKFIWPRTGLKRAWTYIWRRVTRIAGTPHVIALGFAAGAFASITPFVGFHFILAAILALIVGGNVLSSALGTSVGNPLTFPFIWLGTYNFGGFLLGYEHRGEINITLPDGLFWKLISHPIEFWQDFWGVMGPVFVPMLVGSVPIGLVIGTVCYFIVCPAVRSYQQHRMDKVARGLARRREQS